MVQHGLGRSQGGWRALLRAERRSDRKDPSAGDLRQSVLRRQEAEPSVRDCKHLSLRDLRRDPRCLKALIICPGRYLMDGGRWGYRMGPTEIHGRMLRDGLDDAFSGKHSGWHTEDLVVKAQISREVQDRFAARSQRRFSTAQKASKFV